MCLGDWKLRGKTLIIPRNLPEVANRKEWKVASFCYCSVSCWRRSMHGRWWWCGSRWWMTLANMCKPPTDAEGDRRSSKICVMEVTDRKRRREEKDDSDDVTWEEMEVFCLGWLGHLGHKLIGPNLKKKKLTQKD